MSGSGANDDELRSQDLQGLIRRVNGAQSGSTVNFGPGVKKEANVDQINLARIDEYLAAANSGSLKYGASVQDVNKFARDIKGASASTDTLSLGNLGASNPSSLINGYNSHSAFTSTAQDYLTKLQVVFENRKQEILSRSQRPGGAATKVGL